MQVTRATFIPLLAPANADRIDPGAVRDEFIGDLTVVYSFGPQFGRRVVTHADLEQLELPIHTLRRSAHEHLEVMAGRAEFHGQPPALMLSFEGLESSLLLANDFWTRLQGAVPGELVVGVPARDVVVVTGSQSTAGLEKARRCVERVYFAGDENLLSRSLLVRRGNTWEPFDRPAGGNRQAAPRAHGPMRHRGPDQMPRQYQEHPSWPQERVRPVSSMPAQRMPGVPVGPGPMGAVPIGPVSSGGPRAASHTGNMPAVNHTGSMPAVNHTGSMPAVGPRSRHNVPSATMTSTGGMAPVPPAPPAREEYPARPADIAQFSAMPYSAMPYSAAPYSAMPYSAAPYSGGPRSVDPSSGAGADSGYLHSRGARGPQPQQYAQPPAKPRYRDDAYSTGARPLYSYEQSDRSERSERSYRDEPYRAEEPSYRDDRRRDDYYREEPREARPSYPEAWGTAPGRPSRPEWTTGPRARFSR